MRYLHTYIEQIVAPSVTRLTPETPIFPSQAPQRRLPSHKGGCQPMPRGFTSCVSASAPYTPATLKCCDLLEYRLIFG
jgi:hypothetical protein